MRTTHPGDSGSLFAFFRRKRTTTRSWDDATPMELLQARVDSLQESVYWLHNCVCAAFEQTAQRDGSPVRPEVVLEEEWSK